MSKFRLALVRQKYRPDGGAERFVSRALEALDDSDLELNVITREWQGPVKPEWNIHICNPRKWGRISRERGFADAGLAHDANHGFIRNEPVKFSQQMLTQRVRITPEMATDKGIARGMFHIGL